MCIIYFYTHNILACNPEELKEVVIEKKLEEERRCKDLEYQKKVNIKINIFIYQTILL